VLYGVLDVLPVAARGKRWAVFFPWWKIAKPQGVLLLTATSFIRWIFEIG